ncbi:MAG TPA: amino acid adenylation domain-containing protein [Candidatus Limnocylindrales bacterium]|nr:amino acid adenylation domain-containing protein [Candidatus Limnocylindrales bacterium]
MRGIHEAFEQQARLTPDAPAVVAGDDRIGFAELDRRAGAVAHLLRQHGVRCGDPVVLLLERSVAMVVALLGVLKAGGHYVPVDTGVPAARLDFILQDTAARVVLTQAALAGTPAGTPAGTLERLQQTVIAVDTFDGEATFTSSEVDDLAYVMYTSGSTGQPKGVMVPQDGVLSQLLWMQREFGLGPDDRVLQMSPYTFDISVWELVLPLLCGATVVMAAPGGHRDPDHLAEVIACEQVTTLNFVPSRLRLFLAAGHGTECATVKRVWCIGEELPRDLQNAYYEQFSAPLFNLYGPTEASIAVTWWHCQRQDPFEFVPIGEPMDGVDCYVLDEQLQPVPEGELGELVLGGVQVARGYLNRPEQTAKAFVPDPAHPGHLLYRTGDLVRRLPVGGFRYAGRNDFQVKVRGHRIELSEIELTLRQVPGVLAAAVLVEQETKLVAYLELAAENDITTGQLRRRLADTLPEYMIPQGFREVDVFPLSTNGKLDRAALRGVPAREVAGEAVDPPRNEAERLLVEAWARALGTEVGVHDDFFALGGDSLLALRLAAGARRQGLAITSEIILNHRTVAEVARLAHGN